MAAVALFFLQADTEIAEAWGGEGKPRWSKTCDAVDRRMMFANWDNEDDDHDDFDGEGDWDCDDADDEFTQEP